MLQHKLRMCGISGIADYRSKTGNSFKKSGYQLHILYLIHIAVILHLTEKSAVDGDYILCNMICGKSKRKA